MWYFSDLTQVIYLLCFKKTAHKMTNHSVVIGGTALLSVAVVAGLFYASRRRAVVAAVAATEAARLTIEAEAAQAAAESARRAAEAAEATKKANEADKKTKDAEVKKKKDQAAADAAAAHDKAVASAAKAAGAQASVVAKAAANLAPHGAVAVCYGSQTGNAKAIAQELFEELSDAGVTCALADLDSWKKARALGLLGALLVVRSAIEAWLAMVSPALSYAAV
jgi:flagellar biosynthesis GTPase FlhF